MTGPEGAHDFNITLGMHPAEAKIVIDGIEETHCRRIRIEQGVDGVPIVTLELYARSVKIAGQAGEVLELAGAIDDGDEIVVHKYASPGVVRHFKRDVSKCSICTPREIGER